ncbi:MAG: GTPase [Phycisphaerae bacterium]
MPADGPIASLLTPAGKGGIAVIGLAGAGAGRVLKSCWTADRCETQSEGQLRLGTLSHEGRDIDRAIVARTPEGLEINIHGGPEVTRLALAALDSAGAHIADSAHAQPHLPLSHPARNNPAIGAELLRLAPHALGTRLLTALSVQWSAGLSELAGRAMQALDEAHATQLARAAARFTAYDRLLNPAEVVLAGPPNAGKSTLMNLLVGRRVSIAHEQAGTTRDWVREAALLDGLPVWLTDTAGLWNEAKGIDAEAVRRARRRADSADLVLLLSPAETFHTPQWLHARNVLAVATKCDAHPAPDSSEAAVSTVDGTGIDRLVRAILRRLNLADFDPAAPAAFTARQAQLLNRAADAGRAGRPEVAKTALAELLGR